jgi:hypothetical protein
MCSDNLKAIEIIEVDNMQRDMAQERHDYIKSCAGAFGCSIARQVFHIRNVRNEIFCQAFPRLFHLKKSSIDLSHYVGPICPESNTIESLVGELDELGRFRTVHFGSFTNGQL